MSRPIKCPYCGETVNVDVRRWPLGDPAAAKHLEHCRFSPLGPP